MLSGLLRSRSPSPTAEGQEGQPQVDPDVARVQRINVIMEALGVSPSPASAQLHSHPESMHRIASQDLLYIAQHAELLAEHKDVKCDFKALSLLLWAMLGKADVLLDESVMAITAAAATPARAPGLRVADLHAALYSTLTQSTRITRILRAFEEPVARGTLKEKLRVTREDVQVAIRMTEKLAVVMQELTGEVDGAESRRSLSMVEHYAVRGHELLRVCERNISSLWVLLGTLVGRAEVDPVPVLEVFNSERQWRISGFGLLSTESYCRGVAVVAQSLFSRRADFDNGDEVAATLVLDRLSRRPPFSWDVFKLLHYTPALYKAIDKVELPHHRGFGLLLMFAKLQVTMESYLTKEGAALDDVAESTKRGSSESTTKDHLGKRLASVTATRQALSRHFSRLVRDQPVAHRSSSSSGSGVGGGGSGGEEEKAAGDAPALLSFGQLLALAMVNGMPEADLADDAQLMHRATATRLVKSADEGGAVGWLEPHLLRLLLAYAYTVPTSDDEVEHAPLSPPSTTALYRSVSVYFFQEPQFQAALQKGGARGGGGGGGASAAASSPVVNPMCAHPLLRSYLLAQLLVRNACGSGGMPSEGQKEAGERDSAREASEPSEAATTAAAAVPHENTVIPTSSATLLALIQTTVNTMYEVNDAMYEAALAAGKSSVNGIPGAGSTAAALSAVPEQVNVVTALSATLLLFFFDSAAFVREVHLRTALDTLTRVFALRAATPAGRKATARQVKARQDILVRMQRRLAYFTQQMPATDVRATLLERLVPLAHPSKVSHPNRLRLAHLEAFLRSMATSAAAFAIPDELMLAHWVEIALPCVTGRYSAALCVAGHDFFIAPFLAHKAISPLFVPTYIAVVVPTGTVKDATDKGGSGTSPAPGKYGEPPLALVKRFAATARSSCQGLERCDGTALAQLLRDEKSPVSRSLASAYSPARARALQKLTPTSAILLVVSALFDKLCMLWNMTAGYVRDAQQRFATYFSALVNLLQCSNTDVLQRVCASIEAMMVEHMRGSGAVQMEFLKYISLVVDNVRGNSKKGVAEWFLRLSEKMHRETRTAHSKL